jgi:hypothetical protein
MDADTAAERGRRFIDDIMRINEEHGMGTYWPAHEAAVASATKIALMYESLAAKTET